MAKFHRFTDPSYYHSFVGESFPAAPGGTGTIGLHTYDRVNVESGGVGTVGDSANADAQVVAAVTNRYTYFVAFGQDATSLNVNRGFRAAFENLDVVDDILRTSLPRRAEQSLPSPATDNVVVTGEVFVSDDASTPANELFYVVETATGRPIYNGTTRVVVTDVDTGVPGTIIGTGWATDPTVRFNTSINVAYTLYYGTRTTYGRISEIEKSVWWAQNVAAARTAIAGEGQGLHGLDERYRRATNISSASPTPDTPGAGATIVRDGQAVTLQVPATNLTGTGWPDPMLAGFVARNESFGAATQSSGRGGDLGFLALTGEDGILGSTTSEYTAIAPLRAALATFQPRDIRAATIAGGTTYTYIPAGASATLNPAGADTQMVKLDAPYYFKAGGNTGVYSGDDYLVVTRASGEQQAYLLDVDADGLLGLADDEAHLRLPTGNDTLAGFFSAPEVVTVEWRSVYQYYGGIGKGLLQWYQPRALTTDVNDWTGKGREGVVMTGYLHGTLLAGTNTDEDTMRMLTVRAATSDDKRVDKLIVTSNGDVISGGDLGPDDSSATPIEDGGTGQFYGTLAHRSRSFEVTDSVGTEQYNLDPRGWFSATFQGSGLGVINISMNGALTGNTKTVQINAFNAANQRMSIGTVFEIVVHNIQGQRYAMSWFTSGLITWKFSDPDDADAIGGSLVAGSVLRWKGIVVDDPVAGAGNRAILMERLNYAP